MESALNILIPVAMAAVVIVLALGIWNMFRGGSGNRSQLFMRWRVALQFAVIVLVLAGAYFFGNG